MSDLFRRAWRVQVSDMDTSELACKFKITRTLFARAGTCELEVRNLTEAHRRQVIASPRRTTFVEVQAGYMGGVSLLFRGDKRKASVARDGADWTLKVTAGDGEHALRTARVAQSFAGGATVTDVVRHIADAMGVGVGNAVTALAGVQFGAGGGVFEDGTVVQGLASSELTRLCDSARVTWSIQDGNLQILPLNGALEREVIRLAPDCGMVASPEIVNRRVCTVKALLIPGLVPGQRVLLDSQVRRGVHTIRSAEYSGDTHGGDWYATLTCSLPLPPLLSPTP